MRLTISIVLSLLILSATGGLGLIRDAVSIVHGSSEILGMAEKAARGGR